MRCSILVSALVFLVSDSAAAQDLMSGSINQSWGSTQMLLNAEKRAWAAPECINETRWSTHCKGTPPQRARPTTADTAVLDEAALTFRPSPERRQHNFADFIEGSRVAGHAGAEQLRAFLAQDVIGFVAKEVAPLGLRTDDLADAMTTYVMESWEAATAKVMPATRARAQAVRSQMDRAIAAASARLAEDDAAKQEIAETMLVQAVVVSNAIKLAVVEGDRNEIAAVQESAREGTSETLGIDLRSIAVTDAGLR